MWRKTLFCILSEDKITHPHVQKPTESHSSPCTFIPPVCALHMLASPTEALLPLLPVPHFHLVDSHKPITSHSLSSPLLSEVSLELPKQIQAHLADTALGSAC